MLLFGLRLITKSCIMVNISVDGSGLCRTNEIISDMFARLRFMDCRGSGIDRIVRSYSLLEKKPEFYSDVDCFMVTLPNRSVTSSSQDVVSSGQDVASSGQDVASSGQDVASLDQDVVPSTKEVIEFVERVESNSKWTRATKERIILLFKKYRYGYTFNRRNMVDVFGVGNAGATVVLKKLKKASLIISPQYGCYKFVEKK